MFVVTSARAARIRLALGAQSRDVISLFLRRGQAMRLGVVSVWEARCDIGLLQVLIDISPSIGGAGVLMASFLAAVALLAFWVPAPRAKVDPCSTRCE